MGVEFDWQLEEELEAEPPNRKAPRPRRTWLMMLLALFVALGVGGGYVWRSGQDEIDEEVLERTAQVDAILSELAAAFDLGHPDLFFDLAGQDKGWEAAQLYAPQVDFWQGNPAVTTIERRGVEIWANVAWDDGRWQSTPTGDVF